MSNEQSYNFYVKNLSTEFSIVDDDQMIIEGYFTDGKVDIDGHVIDQAGLMAATEDYMRWGNIRDMHGLPVGKVLGFPEWNKVTVQILDDSVWKKVKNGLYKGFSVGIRSFDFINESVFKYTDSDFEGVPRVVVDAIKEFGEVLRITKMLLAEISIVDRPANPRALFTGIKSLESEGYDTLPVPTIVKTAQAKIKTEKGVITMSEKTQELEVENTPEAEVPAEVEKDVADTAETVVTDNQEGQTIEKDVAEDVDSGEVASFENRVAALESKIDSVEKSLNDRFEGFEGQLTKAISLLEKNASAATVQDEAVVEVESKDVETEVVPVEANQEKEVTVDFAKQIAELVSVTVAETMKAIKEKEVENGEQRLGGVNDGAENTEKSAGVEKIKPTYKNIAEQLTLRMRGNGATVN